MNYYERIQKSIDLIENKLEDNIEIEELAKEAYMSTSNYYRMFFALTGYTVKEYVRYRRICSAVRIIKETDKGILNIALKFGFNSNESLTRAFKRITGYPPSAFRKYNLNYYFKRINIMDKYYDVQDTELIEKYPDIKVLKKIEPFRVAYYCSYGIEPENESFQVICDWLKRSGLNYEKNKLRIFGFNNPDPAGTEQKEYGYEVWVTIGDNVVVNDSLVKAKMFEGGLYAMCSIRSNMTGDCGLEITHTWQRFSKWLAHSKYVAGEHQWLEEHLHFNDEFKHTDGIDLYMPIAPKDTVSKEEKQIVHVEPINTVSKTFNGKNAYKKALDYMFNFVIEYKDYQHKQNHRIFCYYNQEKTNSDDFWCKVHISVEKDFTIADQQLKFEVFEGGLYAYEEVDWKNNAKKWYRFIEWIKVNQKYDFDNRHFMEEYIIDSPKVKSTTKVRHFMPIKIRSI